MKSRTSPGSQQLVFIMLAVPQTQQCPFFLPKKWMDSAFFFLAKQPLRCPY